MKWAAVRCKLRHISRSEHDFNYVQLGNTAVKTLFNKNKNTFQLAKRQAARCEKIFRDLGRPKIVYTYVMIL